jgi:hypothetical protein
MESAVSAPLDDEAVLLAKIERLERRAFRNRALALGVLALALVTARAPSAPAAPTSLAVRAADGSRAVLDGSGLSITSATGTKRLEVGIDTAGGPAATEFDPAGNARQELFLYANGAPSLRQYDAAHVIRMEIYLASTGEPTMHLYTPQAVAQLAFFIGDKGVPEFDVRNKRGVAMGYLSADDQGGYLVMRDPTPTTRAYIGQYTDGTWGLDVRNAQNQNLFKKP